MPNKYTFDPSFRLETERVALEPISHKYIENINAEFTSELTTYMYPKPAESIDDTVEFVEGSISKNQDNTDLELVIIDKNTNEFIGCCGLYNPRTKTPEFGIWIAKKYHGQKIGREVITALKNWAETNFDFDYFIYPVDKANIASRKIPESLGGKIYSEYEKINQSGEKLNLIEFHIPAKSNNLNTNKNNFLTKSDIDKIETDLTAQGLELLVDCFVLNDKGQVLAQKRSPERRLYPNCWDFPGGHVDTGDSLYNTIFKEIKEELNLDVSEIVDLVKTVKWEVPTESLREGENPNKVILQFIVKVKNFDDLKLEEGKAVAFEWFDLNNIEKLKEGGSDNLYPYESIEYLFKNYKFVTSNQLPPSLQA